jgi:hypothetical protein
MTALRDRSHATMYRPGKVAALVADLSLGIAMIAVGVGCIIASLLGA